MATYAHPHPALVRELFDEIIDKISQGETVTEAMRGTAHNAASFYRWVQSRPEWSQRFAEARQLGAQVNADKVDKRVEELVYQDQPAPGTVALWAKRHNPAYRDKLELDVSTNDARPFENMTAAELEALVAQIEARVQPQPQLEAGTP